jgi:PAS domain S-box-containing protein
MSVDASDGAPARQSSRAIRWLRLSIAASLVVPVTILAVAAWYTREAALAEAADNTRRAVATLAEHALKVFETHGLVIDQVDERVRGLTCDAMRNSPDLQQYLARSVRHAPQIETVWVIDESGLICAASNPDRIDRNSRADRDYFSGAQKTDRIFIGRALIGRIGNIPFFSVARRRSSPGGQFTGIVLAAIELKYFIEYYRSIAPAQEHRIALYRKDGALLALTPAASTVVDATREGRVAEWFSVLEGVRIGPSVADGVERIAAWKVLPDWGIAVTYALGKADVLRDWRDAVLFYGLVAVLASAALVGVAAAALQWVRREQTAAAALRSRDALYAGVFQKTMDGIFVVSVTAEGRLAYETINPALERQTGQRAEDVAGRSPEEIFPLDEAAPIVARYRECIERGEPISYSVTATNPGRRTIWQTSLTPIHEDNRVVRLVGTTSNVTLQTEAEEALRQTQKMEAIGHLTGGIAHDFNNLLTVVIGNLDFLRMSVPEHRQRRMVDAALAAASRGAKLTRQMLTFGRRQMLRPERYDINALLAEFDGMIGSAAAHAVQLEYQFDAAPADCLVDRAELELAILNIAVNARQAMPEGGVLKIETDTIRIAREERDVALAQGDYLRIAFSDTGPGMPPDILARAFEPFFTTKDVGQGTGLGLSQVYGFAKQSGGLAAIESTIGSGTTVSLYLPLATGADHRAAGVSDERSVSSLVALNGTILVVDDTPDVLETVAEMLEAAGCTVLRAENGEEGLALVRAYCRRLDLMLIDIVMLGGLSGPALADRAMQACPGLKVMLMTGYANAEHFGGDYPLLKKPLRRGDLIAAVGTAISGNYAPNIR